ncbi:VWA domain-containing protein [Rudanella paleaurantiibacter]|uniref:VWA domain-containing protein n=1 Tax=Rudanella paleaurantiibacter TaxID=2614655 RepID=A0A7J5TT15_9BACT|nr:vWA domain-containing protein [Rudanella paleaurantiibacter]KAB7726844.1 VWA domain-containing protein [Rudanella paleaurantiibacter]
MNTPLATPVFNLIILDESGSMGALRQTTLNGFNEIVQTIQTTAQQFPEQPQFVSFVTFNGSGIRTILDKEPADRLRLLTSHQYQPNGGTPLFDAMGRSLMRLELQLEQETNPTVLVSVLTDGEENASREFTAASVRAMVERLKQNGWSFTYMGANHAVENAAASIAITNLVRFVHTPEGIEQVFLKERKGRMAYYEKKRRGMSSRDAEADYFNQE